MKCLVGNSINYIVPQRLEKSGDLGDIPIFFRVKEPARNVTLELLSKGESLVRVKRKKVNPGEMEKIVINSNLLDKLGDEIKVEVAEVKG